MTLPALTDMSLTIGHKPEADAYPKWGGVWAVLKWHDLGATAFDCDVQISADGTPWAIHWADWWKHSVVVKPGEPSVPHVVISQLKDAAIRRLVHRDGWEINTVREVLEAAARLNIVPCLEAKSDHRFEGIEVWEQIKADALEVGCPVVAMTIQDYPTQSHARLRLTAAHAAGIPTLLLSRGPISSEWWKVLDGAKGTQQMVGTPPAGKVRLGLSTASATKHGCSCAPTTAKAATARVLQLGGKRPPVLKPEVQVDPMSVPVSARNITLAESYGLKNVGPAALASRAAGLYFYAACALLEKESGGRNVYGHDAGGALSGYPGIVDASNFDVFRWLVFDKGQTSNGVGPCQLTFKGFFTDMDAKGLKPYVIADNLLYGFTLLASYYKEERSWEAAGKRYNGGAAYGKDLAAKVKVWQSRFRQGR